MMYTAIHYRRQQQLVWSRLTLDHCNRLCLSGSFVGNFQAGADNLLIDAQHSRQSLLTPVRLHKVSNLLFVKTFFVVDNVDIIDPSQSDYLREEAAVPTRSAISPGRFPAHLSACARKESPCHPHRNLQHQAPALWIRMANESWE